MKSMNCKHLLPLLAWAVFVGIVSAQPVIDDANSRAFTVENVVPAGPPLAIADAHSRAFTVENVVPPGPPLAIGDAHSRAFTVLNCISCAADPSTCDAQPDCNENGFNDLCEMLTGIMPDCNGNGIPDDCEVTPCATCLGDVNGDGAANGKDIQPFVDILLAEGASDCGDIDLSGGPLDTTDLQDFVCRLLGAPTECLP